MDSYTDAPRITIEKRSHGVRCYGIEGNAKRLLMSFAAKYVEYGMTTNKNGEPDIKRVFATALASRDEFYFHIGQYEDLILHLVTGGVTRDAIRVIEVPMYEPAAAEYQWMDESRTPREAQIIIRDFIAANKTSLVTLQTGKGKAQPLDAKILGASGWTTMGEMKVGSRLRMPDGTIARVTDVYPQGMRYVARLSFAYGRSTEADLDHLWKVSIDGVWQLMMTRQLFGHLMESDVPVYIPMHIGDPRYGDETLLRLESIEVSDEMRECQCIAVDHPEHLYITDDDIVTHNTFTSMVAMHFLGLKTMLFMNSGFIDQWKTDLEATLGLDEDRGDIVTIRGTPALIKFMKYLKSDDDRWKVVMISNDTFRTYYKSFKDQDPTHSKYPIAKPWDFFELARAGLKIVDEVHINFHVNFMVECLGQFYKTASLSATMESGKDFMDSIYKIMYPKNTWAPVPEYDRYIDALTKTYYVRDNHVLKYKNVFGQYSHVEYEKSLMRRPGLLREYLKMAANEVNSLFVRDMVPGQKLLVFVAMIEMCDHLVAYLRKAYPKMRVTRFVGVDPESNLADTDIIVSTPKSCGTAKDIAGLRNTLMTVAMDAQQMTQQLVGRLRRLKDWPDVNPSITYLFNHDNPKHNRYQKDLRKKLSGRVRHYRTAPGAYMLESGNHAGGAGRQF